VPFLITKEFVILCEGAADQVFFERLLSQRKITDFDIPPHGHPPQGYLGRHFGVDGLGGMLRTLAGDAIGYAKLKGVLIIADAASSASSTFNKICRKIEGDGPFVAPEKFLRPGGPNQISPQGAGHPRLSILLIPLNGAGALETICVESIIQKKPWIAECVNAYLACGEIRALKWRPEKRDKARLQCVIAALNESDPNKGLQYLLRIEPPLVHFRSKVFTPIVRQILNFRDGVNSSIAVQGSS